VGGEASHGYGIWDSEVHLLLPWQTLPYTHKHTQNTKHKTHGLHSTCTHAHTHAHTHTHCVRIDIGTQFVLPFLR